MQRSYSLLVIRSYFPHDCVHKLLCLFPEFLVHCQVNEEVADVVDVVEVEKNFPRQVVVNFKDQRYEADDVDDCDEDELRHCHHVTSVCCRPGCVKPSSEQCSTRKMQHYLRSTKYNIRQS